MIEKLELKHIAPYLPYRLKCKVTDRGKIVISDLNAAYSDNSYAFMNIVESEKGFDEIKPILRPLSDLTKEIEVNGERFVPIEVLLKLNNKTWFDKHDSKSKYSLILSESNYGRSKAFVKYHAPIEINIIHDFILHESFTLVQKLHEWHFDVFGLIDSGLAIDINTL